MRVSLSWLSTLCDAGLHANELAEGLTRQGLEVSAVVPVPAPSERIVAARLETAVPIPRTNFKLIEARAGAAGTFAIVSAAPNVRPGMLAALALPGARLPDGRVIAAREYAGQVSEAMLCSAVELALGETSDRLLELPEQTEPGTSLATLYDLPDICLEIELTPNRGDCLSMFGIAREVHALSGAPLVPPAIAPIAPGSTHGLDIRFEASAACPRYLGRIVSGLDESAVTPLWMAERLRRAGVHGTHPVVDVLNYVMLELGQPLHAFDRERIRGTIHVRTAQPGETLRLLTNATAKLENDMLVIADDSGPLALAGIMGGAASAVRCETRSVFLESAFFAPAAIRGHARRLGLVTDAAHRYERGVDPELPRRALERATELILAIAGGEPGPIMATESAADLPRRTPIRFHPAARTRLAGLAPDASETERVLTRLGFAIEPEGDALRVTPPGFRFDIECEADLVEEVARIVGFDHIPAAAPARQVAFPRDSKPAPDRLTEILTAHGYDEAVTMSFADPGRDALLGPNEPAALALANPLSEYESVLRRTLWTGLMDALAYNVARQADRVRLFERGTVFTAEGGERKHLAGIACGATAPEQWGVRTQKLDFYDVKGDVEMLLMTAGVTEPAFVPGARAALAPGRRARVEANGRMLAEFGVIAPELAEHWKLPHETVLFELDLDVLPKREIVHAQPVPRFPGVRRDLAIVVADSVPAATLLAGVRRFGGERLLEVRIFDSYSGNAIPSEHRSVGLALIFRDLSRTLTDAEVDASVSAIMTGLEQEMGAHVRN